MGKSPAQIRADKRMRTSIHNEIVIGYGAASLALWDELGWREKRVMHIYEDSRKMWIELTKRVDNGEDIHMLKVLEDETGIELKFTENGKSWHEMAYFNGTIINATGKQYDDMYYYMRMRQSGWARAQTLASIFIVLHRRYGFGAERLQKLMEGILNYTNMSPKQIKRLCIRVTGIDPEEETRKEEAVDT